MRKLDIKEVRRRVAAHGMVLAGEYAGATSKTLFRCQSGHEWNARPSHVMKGHGCPHCTGHAPLTPEAINERLLARNITIIGPYTNADTKALFRCLYGHEWMARPYSVLGNHGCPHCTKREPLTKEIVNSRISGRGLFMIGDYTNANTRVDFGCGKGHKWVVSAGAVMAGRGCPHCAGLAPLSKDIVNERIAHRGIVMIGEYRGVGKKSLFRCSHGHSDWMVAPTNVLNGVGCPRCADKTLSKEIVNKRIEDRGIVMVGEYKTANTKTRFKCGEGHEWSIYPAHVLSGSGCPSCATYGYKVDNPAVLYVFSLVRGDKTGIGFGVSTRFKNRHSDHKTTFKKTDTKATLLAKVDFKTGWDARAVEDQLKQHPAIIDFGIEGFRTECLPIEYKDFILSTIHQYSNSE